MGPAQRRDQRSSGSRGGATSRVERGFVKGIAHGIVRVPKHSTLNVAIPAIKQLARQGFTLDRTRTVRAEVTRKRAFRRHMGRLPLPSEWAPSGATMRSAARVQGSCTRGRRCESRFALSSSRERPARSRPQGRLDTPTPLEGRSRARPPTGGAPRPRHGQTRGTAARGPQTGRGARA